MQECSDLPFPSSFDPALHLHSEPPEAHQFDTDIEILNEQQRELTAAKTKAGIVIQHSRRDLEEELSSEFGGIVPSSPLNRYTRFLDTRTTNYTMPYMASSPLEYPRSSSPVEKISKKRKRDADNIPRSPLREIEGNTLPPLGPFVEDDSDEDGESFAGTGLKKLRPLPDPSPEPSESSFGKVNGEPEPSEAADSLHAEQHKHDATRHDFAACAKVNIIASTGRNTVVLEKPKASRMSYEALIAQRSEVVAGRAQQSYYGLNIHELMDAATAEAAELESRRQCPDVLAPVVSKGDNYSKTGGKPERTLMWTEKYRARKFTDLVGDERTHRSVLRWLKGWDRIVFPGSARGQIKPKPHGEQTEERFHRKILLITGPPGLGKTTLAHVCAKQAGYEVQEINASDERSSNVVRGRIRDMVGTENIRNVGAGRDASSRPKAAKPVCVVVDEVDGVVSGSGGGGGGEGGFVKALIDLVMLDERNSKQKESQAGSGTSIRKSKGDNFRMLRPLILICNDVYHPSLRPLRQSTLAEIVHMRKPALNTVVARMQTVFTREGIECDSDGVRRLCEATWGVSNHKEGSGSGTVEGDIRSIMVVAEGIAGRLRSTRGTVPRFSRRWFEENMLGDLGYGGGSARSIGRGGAREVVDRVFVEGAGFPKTQALDTSVVGKGAAAVGVAEGHKRRAFDRLRHMVDSSGDADKIVTDVFTVYPTHPYQDDMFISKPNVCHDWLHFHDVLSSQVFGSQEWELAPYLSSSTLAFHHLFACSATRSHLYAANGNAGRGGFRKGQPAGETSADNEGGEQRPFSGPGAPFEAMEATKANRASVVTLQNSLSLRLARMYRSLDDVATELLPYVLRMINPDVKPVVINTGSKSSSGGSGPTSTATVRKASEKALVCASVEAMIATGISFSRAKVELEAQSRPGQTNGGWIFRMEPALDVLGTYETRDGRDKINDSVRFAVRQVLNDEHRREVKKRENEARSKRGGVEACEEDEGKSNANVGPVVPAVKPKAAKRDFFGRIFTGVPLEGAKPGLKHEKMSGSGSGGRVWCSFHEGLNRAVRKPITLDELMRGL